MFICLLDRFILVCWKEPITLKIKWHLPSCQQFPRTIEYNTYTLFKRSYQYEGPHTTYIAGPFNGDIAGIMRKKLRDLATCSMPWLPCNRAKIDEMTSKSSCTAAIVAIGTALPKNVCMQKNYAESLFQGVEANSKYDTLKEKVQNICDSSEITKRHLHLQPRFHPCECISITNKFAAANEEVPKLMSEAASKALKEWGQPASLISHLVVATSTGLQAPGADYQLMKQDSWESASDNHSDCEELPCSCSSVTLDVPQGCFAAYVQGRRFIVRTEHLSHPLFCSLLQRAEDEYGFQNSGALNIPCEAVLFVMKILGLKKDVKRVMLYFQGCFAGAAAVRIAKDLAENNRGSRVLVACCEMASLWLHGLREDIQERPAQLLSTALFGDGAGCVILAPDPVPGLERPWFEVHLAKQVLVSDDTAKFIGAKLHEDGPIVHLARQLPKAIQDTLPEVLGKEFLEYTGCKSYNDMFWVVHPGGKAILDSVTASIGIMPEKLTASRHVLSECGNMASASILFVLEETRRRPAEPCQWGIMLAFGSGITVEAILLKNPML